MHVGNRRLPPRVVQSRSAIKKVAESIEMYSLLSWFLSKRQSYFLLQIQSWCELPSIFGKVLASIEQISAPADRVAFRLSLANRPQLAVSRHGHSESVCTNLVSTAIRTLHGLLLHRVLFSNWNQPTLSFLWAMKMKLS